METYFHLQSPLECSAITHFNDVQSLTFCNILFSCIIKLSSLLLSDYRQVGYIQSLFGIITVIFVRHWTRVCEQRYHEVNLRETSSP